ncbi:MAG: helix-turn-helix domain-containing protein [Eubacteriales bacterium]
MNVVFAENVKKFRTERRFTQSDLAALLSVSPQAVSRWENSQAYPDIETLPLLAQCLGVSIDDLMGVGDHKKRKTKDELIRRLRFKPEDRAADIENELRILDIYEELGRSEQFYLTRYFARLMSHEKEERPDYRIPEERIEKARQMLRERMRTANFADRMKLLNTVAHWEDEDKLELWEDEYSPPENMECFIWDGMLHSRYALSGDAEKLKAQNQKLIFEYVESTLSYLMNCGAANADSNQGRSDDLVRHITALSMLELYSSRADDIFIGTRIVAEVRCAEALLACRRDAEGLEMLASAGAHIAVLRELPDGAVLHGSVPVLDTVSVTFGYDDKYIKCLMNIHGCDRKPVYDRVRREKVFIDFFDSIKDFFPHEPCRSWILSQGGDEVDEKWESLLDHAKKAAESLTDGQVVVMLTEKGNIYSIKFKDTDSAIDGEGVFKLLLDMKKRSDARIERLVGMWHDGSIDMPSFAVRKYLVDVDRKNLFAGILMNGIESYVVKTVKSTMPKGYDENI